MIHIDIRPVWRFRTDKGERAFDFQLIAILAELDVSSKLTAAAESAGVSYRHAWNLVADWEAFFGAPLVHKAQGRGSRLTPLGRSLLWAGQRAQARLAPELDNLASEFADALNASLSETSPALLLHASHDYAIGRLRELAAGTDASLALQYKGSFDALTALRRGECDLAGFHLPGGRFGELMARRYAECLPLDEYRLVSFVTRTQGLIVRAGNPKAIRGVSDLCRPDVRMVNRQRGSGTRALLEFMISFEGLDRSLMRGYDLEETTHGAVAALVAGNQADAGVGIQAAAAQYRLDFVPLATERYYLACRKEDVEMPAMRQLLTLLRGQPFAQMVREFAGYSAQGAGLVHDSFENATPIQEPR